MQMVVLKRSFERQERLEDGLLRVCGRLASAPVPYEKKHPIILPYKHHVTDLIIKQYHESLGHIGQECVLSSLREAGAYSHWKRTGTSQNLPLRG